MAVGCTTLNISPVADGDDTPAATTSAVKIEFDKSYILGDMDMEVTLTLTMDNSNPNRKWGSADIYLKSDKAQYLELLENQYGKDGKDKNLSFDAGEFSDKYEVNLRQINDADLGFLHFSLSGNGLDKAISASTALVVKFKLHVDSNIPITEDSKSIKLYMEKSNMNYIASYGYDGSDDKGGEIYEAGETTGASHSPLDITGADENNTSNNVELRPASKDASLSGLQIFDLDANGEAIEDSINVGTFATPITTLTYTTAGPSKDVFAIKPVTTNANSKVVISILGEEIDTITGSGKVTTPLKGQSTAIVMKVVAEDGGEKTYTLTVSSTYIGLGDVEVTTDETVKVSEDKKGLQGEISPDKDEYEILVPYSQGVTGSANTITIKPSILAGYGMDSNITVINAIGCTPNSTSVSSGVAFTIPMSSFTGTDHSISLQLKGSTGTTKPFKLKFTLVSVDTRIDTLTAVGENDGVGIPNSKTDSDLADYKFALPKESGYKATLNITTTDEDAVVKIVDKAGTEYPDFATTALAPGQYKMTITAPAGNVSTEYVIEIVKEIVNPKMVEFGYKLDNAGDIYTSILDSDKFDKDTNTFTLDVELAITEVYFKFAITDQANAKGSNITLSESGVNDNGYRVYTASLANLEIGQKEATITITNDNNQVNTYKIVINQKEKDYSIHSIGFDDENIDFDFQGNEEKQAVTVPYGTKNVDITVIANGQYPYVYYLLNGVEYQLTRSTADNITQTKHVGNIKLNSIETTTTIEIYAKGSNGIDEKSNTYILEITIENPSTINTLDGLSFLVNGKLVTDGNESTATDQERISSFDKDTLYYDVQLNPQDELTSVKVVATPTDSTETIYISGVKVDSADSFSRTFDLTGVVINTNPIEYKVRVVPQNSKYGTNERIYVIRLFKGEMILNDDDSIYGLEIIGNDGKNYSEFKAGDTELTFSVPYSVSDIRFALKISPSATFKVVSDIEPSADNLYRLEAGGHVNTFTIEVQAQNEKNAPTKFVVKVTREAAKTNANLKELNIQVPGGGLLLGTTVSAVNKFNPNEYSYTIKVKHTVNNITLNAITIEEKAEISFQDYNGVVADSVTNKYTKALDTIPYGTSRTYTIKVAIDGSYKTYSVTLIREKNIPVLESLNVTADGQKTNLYDGAGNVVEFDQDVFEYTIRLDNKVASFKLNCVAISGMVVAFNGGNNGEYLIRDLFDGTAGGKEVITFNVNSTDGSATREYTINVVRKGTPDSEVTGIKMSSNVLNGFKFNDEGSDSYKGFAVDYKVATIDDLGLDIDTAGKDYTIKSFDKNGKNLNGKLAYGLNTIRIEVKSTDETQTRVITIEVTRTPADIKGVVVTNLGDNSKIDTGIKPNNTNRYSFAVGFDVSSISIKLLLESGYTATTKEINDLKPGEMSEVAIDIIDEATGEVVNTIYFNVLRTAKEAGSSMIWIIVASVLGAIILILLIIMIILLANRGKRSGGRKGNINDIGIGDYELD
ncbi:MAG: cadherin-like beta sandwich domain-containing protein [Clostridia bacterium]|nr:cadherin-like beta sandwich domain-containing protein [Clostridia bacterium]